MAACVQKTAWDGFTKPQRKSINQWKDAAAVSQAAAVSHCCEFLLTLSLSLSLYYLLSLSFQGLSEEMQAALDGNKETSSEEPVTKKVRVTTPEPTPGIIHYL